MLLRKLRLRQKDGFLIKKERVLTKSRVIQTSIIYEKNDTVTFLLLFCLFMFAMLYLMVQFHNRNFTVLMICDQFLRNNCKPDSEKNNASPKDKKETFCVNNQLRSNPSYLNVFLHSHRCNPQRHSSLCSGSQYFNIRLSTVH